jgi:universal stress protein A
MTIKKIVCCTDFSENSEVAFQMALEMAEKYGAYLFCIHVLPEPVNPLITELGIPIPDGCDVHQNLIRTVEKKMEEEYGSRITKVKYECVVLDGHISSEIIDFLLEYNIDLVVLGSYGLTGMGLVIFGSIAKRVAHKAPCSVMIARNRQEKNTNDKS